jgi:hypothetical protein
MHTQSLSVVYGIYLTKVCHFFKHSSIYSVGLQSQVSLRTSFHVSCFSLYCQNRQHSLCVAHQGGVLGCTTVVHQVSTLCQKMVFSTVPLAQYSICQYDQLPPNNQVNRLLRHHNDTQHQLCADDI